MKKHLSKWLAALLIAALLTSPAALMEERVEQDTAAEESVVEDAAVVENDAKDDADAEDAAVEMSEEPADDIVAAEAVDPDADELTADFDGDTDEVEWVELNEAAYGEEGETPSTVSDSIPINKETFPDDAFRQYVIEYIANGEASLSKERALQWGSIFLDEDAGVEDLTGLEYFPNIFQLYVTGNPVKNLDVSGFSRLDTLECNNCKLETLNVTDCVKLDQLECYDNPSLKSVDITGCTALQPYCTLENKTLYRDDYGPVWKGFRYKGEEDYYIAYLSMDFDVELIPHVDGYTLAPVPIDKEHFPDEAFRGYLLRTVDKNGDSILSEKEIVATTYMALFEEPVGTKEYTCEDISSLEGIQNFIYLDYLGCAHNPIEKLDVSGLALLRDLDCSYCGLKELNLTGCKALSILSCQINALKEVDISDCPILVENTSDDNDGDWGDHFDSRYLGYRRDEGHICLFFDFDTSIIREKAAPPVEPDPTDAPAPAETPSAASAVSAPAAVAAAPAPVVTAPVEVANTVVTITAVKAAAKSVVYAAPGTVAQLDLGGAIGKSFKSSNKKVATVNSAGQVTVKKAGKTKITMKVGRKKRSVTLTIKDPTVPTSVTLIASGPLTGRKGESVILTPVLPENTTSGIKWKSSNKKVATVKNGVVVFKKPGKATITATCTRGKKKARVKVTVTK